MNQFQIYLTHIDEGIKSMHKFIKTIGEEPVKPDACEGEAYTSQKFGDLGEQYVKCLLKERAIKKLQKEGCKSSPDYEITINGKRYILEVKTVSNLYKNPLGLLIEIAKEERHNKIIFDKIKNIFENYDFSVNPSEVHREDDKNFKGELKKKLLDLKFTTERVSFVIECKSKKYKISIIPKNIKIKGNYSLFTGFLPDETKTLSNIISKKSKQIGNCDILIVILLNRNVGADDLLDFFYRPINLCL